LVLQAWEDTPPTTHAIIVIGALDKTLDVPQGTQSLLSSNLEDWLVDPPPICFRVNIAVLSSGWEIFLLVVAGISERL